jgi:hypothetical protein
MAILVRRKWFHVLFVALVLAYQISWIWRLFDTLI